MKNIKAELEHNKKNEKVIFVLGAGFSIEAGAPSQYKIVDEILKLKEKYPEDVAQFTELLSQVLNINSDQYKDISLEDIFTPLDKCLAEGLSFRQLDHLGILSHRENINKLISLAIENCINSTEGKDTEYIEIFAEYLVKLSKKRAGDRYKKVDNVSVISTNWDILLDKRIKDNLKNKDIIGVIDYCCHISSYEEDDDSIKPALEVLGRGGFNVKLLKLHGSLNWLQCPRCQRLYVSFDSKISTNASGATCRHCNRNFKGEDNAQSFSHLLSSNLIMPTFLKNLSNIQYKIIWQNAGIELSEANKIIFIGYSLPLADFEMRQLLSRMTRKSVDIEVVTYFDEKNNDCKNKVEFEALKYRYETFFGNPNIEFHTGGAKKFITDYIAHQIDN